MTEDSPQSTPAANYEDAKLNEDKKYNRLFVAVSECNGYPNKEKLDEIIRIVHEDHKPENSTTY